MTKDALLSLIFLFCGVGGLSAAPSPVIAPCESADEWEGGTLADAPVKAGLHSLRWAHGESATLRLREVPADWTAYNGLGFWLYSEKATGSRFMLILPSEREEVEGMDYYAFGLHLNFTGWREYRLRFRDFDIARQPLGWDRIGGFYFTATGWGNEPDPEAVVYVDEVQLMTREELQGPRMSDEAFFEALDLDGPGLEPVQAAVGRGDLAAAKHEFVAHLKRREAPRWFFDWRDRPGPEGRPANPNTANADRYARNELPSVGVWHAFGEDVDWNFNPMENQYAEWTWQLNRHPFWAELGRAYWDTGDEKYAEAFVRQMTDWVRDQPLPQNAANGAYSAWRTIETGIRTFSSWPDSFYYFLGSPSFYDEAVVMMVKSFAEHAEHLMDWPQSGNWLTMECNGLFCIGVLFPEFKRAETWRQTALDRLYRELDAQVYPDGAQVELTPGYHNVSLGSFEQPIRLARLNGIALPDGYIAKLERMFNYDLYVTMPNRCAPGLNDSDDADERGWLRRGYEYFPQRTDFLWLATEGKEGTKPEHTSYAFPYAGHYVMRSGWDRDARYLLFDAGPFGYGHQHEDKLHFVLYAYGKKLVTDPGNYAYDNSPWRRYVIDSWAHNVVLVDGQPQRRRGQERQKYIVREPEPHTWITTDAFDYAAGVYDEGFGQPDQRIATHTRRILFVKSPAGRPLPAGDAGEYWVLADTLTPNDGEAHCYEAMFHLDVEDVVVDEATKRVTTANADAANLAIIPAAPEGLEVAIIRGQKEPFVQGWVPADGYEVRPIPTAVYAREGAGPQHFLTVLYPVPADVEVPVERVEVLDLTAETARVRIHFRDGRIDEVHLGLEPRVERR